MSIPLEAPRTTHQRTRLGLAAAGCALLLLCLLCGGVLAAWTLANRRPVAASNPSVEYVLDASPRMALPADTGEGSRLSVAQSVLDEIIRPSSPAVTGGLRVFGTGKLADACADTDLLVPLAPANQTKITASLATVSEGLKADAALAAAVVGALRDLAGASGSHTLVVVTGGSDSCSAQAGQLIVAEAKRDGIDYQLFVIGYLVPGDQGSAVSSLVDQASNGHFIPVHSRDQLRAVLRSIQQYVEAPATTTVVQVLATAAAVAPVPTSSASGTQTPIAGSQTATPLPTATTTATFTPAPTASPTTDLAPKVVSFLARFDPVRRSTFYSVTVSSPVSATAGGPALTYHWSKTNPCGQLSGTDTPVAEWNHPDQPGGCPNEPVHAGLVTVIVANAYGATECDYAGGSAPGNIVQCHAVPKPGT